MGKQTDAKELSILREARRRKQLCKLGGILMSEKEALDYRRSMCGGCGKARTNPKRYFGEIFCSDCVEKWNAGKR